MGDVIILFYCGSGEIFSGLSYILFYTGQINVNLSSLMLGQSVFSELIIILICLFFTFLFICIYFDVSIIFLCLSSKEFSGLYFIAVYSWVFELFKPDQNI